MTSHDLTIFGYLAFVGAGASLELIARRPDSRIPTFTSLLGRAMQGRAGRVGVFAGWAWVGLHFFAR